MRRLLGEISIINYSQTHIKVIENNVGYTNEFLFEKRKTFIYNENPTDITGEYVIIKDLLMGEQYSFPYYRVVDPLASTLDEFFFIINAMLDGSSILVSLNGGTEYGPAYKLNFIEGSDIAITVAEDNANGRVDVTINSTAVGSGMSVNEVMAHIAAY